MLVIGRANAARHGTTLTQRVAHTEAYHGIFILRTFGQRCQELAHHLEGIASVEVVAVDNGKRFLDGLLAHQHGMVRTPRFRAALGTGKAFGQVVERLEHQLAGDVAFVFGKNLLAEIFFKILADDEDKFAESGLDGVIDGVVHNSFTVGTQSVQLLQTTVTAAHTGCQ